MTHPDPDPMLALIQLGGPEILIVILLMAVLLAVTVIGVVFVIVKTRSKPQGSAPPPGSTSREGRLRELESLRTESLISEDEFQERRQKVLEGL